MTDCFAITPSVMQSSPQPSLAALAPRKEFPSLIPGCHNRPADVFLPHWDRGLPTALDISVISTLQQQRTVHGAAENQRYALSICEERKMATHAASCREVGVSFIPLAVESLGGWSDLAAKTISRIGRLLGQRLGIPPPSPLANCFRGAPCRCGEGMLPCGYTVSLQSPPSLTVLSDFPFLFCYTIFGLSLFLQHIRVSCGICISVLFLRDKQQTFDW